MVVHVIISLRTSLKRINSWRNDPSGSIVPDANFELFPDRFREKVLEFMPLRGLLLPLPAEAVVAVECAWEVQFPIFEHEQ